MSRRARRRAELPMTFFSFQDIITAVTGILLLVTLMMALDLVTRKEISHSAAVTPEDQSNVDLALVQSRTEVASAADRLRTLQSALSKRRTGADPLLSLAVVEQEMAALQRERESIEREVAASEATLDAAKMDQSRATEELNAVVTDLENVQAESQNADKNTLVLLPGNSSKNALLIECSEDRLQVAEVQTDGELRILQAFDGVGAMDDFSRWGARRDRNSEYFVVLVRPDGAARAMSVVDGIREMGFDVGWDAIEPQSLLFR